jgi:hypothetical protein
VIVREVRLVGDPSDVRSILSLAVQRVPDAERAAWLHQVAGVANKRAKTATASPTPTTVAPASGRAAGWWVALVVGVAAAFAGATVLLPPRNEGNQDPVLAMAVAVPATVLGAGVLVALALLALPAAARRSTTAVACAVIAAIAAVAGAVFALLRRETLVAAAGVPAYLLWWVATTAVLVAAGLLVARIRMSPPNPATPRRLPPEDMARDVAVSADRAATHLPYGSEERRVWRASLARDAVAVAAEVRVQAERLGPFAYVAWAAYGGHVDARELDELIRRG